MCCRLHGYPTAPLISYKIPGIGTLWEFVVPLSKVSTLVAQGPILGHYVLSSHSNRCGLVTTSSPALPSMSGRKFQTVTQRQTSAMPCTKSPERMLTLRIIWGTPTWNTGSACDTFRTGLHLDASASGYV